MDIPSAWYVSLQISVAYACTITNKQKGVQFLIALKAHHQKKHDTTYSQNVENHLDCCKHAIETPKKETHRQSKPEVCTESKSHTENDPEYQPNVLGRCQLLSYLEAPSYL